MDRITQLGEHMTLGMMKQTQFDTYMIKCRLLIRSVNEHNRIHTSYVTLPDDSQTVSPTQTTSFCQPIQTDEQLAITLQYLVTSDSIQNFFFGSTCDLMNILENHQHQKNG